MAFSRLGAAVSDESAAACVEEVTGLLRSWRAGEVAPSERLFALVYPELKRLAHRQLARERHGHTLQTTALVHEAYLRLVDQTRVDWRDRGHFFAVAATLMRRVLVDYARARLAAKRAHERLTLTTGAGAAAGNQGAAFEVLDLDWALDRLAAAYARQARVVELRVFGGLELAEIGDALGVAERTVKRDWAFACAWLARELSTAETAGEREARRRDARRRE
jgi:RNA polymerase sigma factor (TIGR02999 family)